METYEVYSPLIPVFGLQRQKITKTNYNFYCVEEKLKFITLDSAMNYFYFFTKLAENFLNKSEKYLKLWRNNSIKVSLVNRTKIKPILFCEGEIDLDLIKRSAELLGKNELLSKFILRERGGRPNLDKLWISITQSNWMPYYLTKILLYDCDTEISENESPPNYKKIIPKIEEHPIQKGIENLFPKSTFNKAKRYTNRFFDIVHSKGTKRGEKYKNLEISINKHEKRNFCTWVIENGGVKDFKHFITIFNILENILEKEINHITYQ